MVPQISKDGKEGHAIMLCADSAGSGEWKRPFIANDVNLKLESSLTSHLLTSPSQSIYIGSAQLIISKKDESAPSSTSN